MRSFPGSNYGFYEGLKIIPTQKISTLAAQDGKDFTARQNQHDSGPLAPPALWLENA